MKLQLFAVLLVVAGSYALPRTNEVFVTETSNEKNFVENRIRSFIEQTSKRIVNAGLDPREVERKDVEINPGNLKLVVKTFIENVRFTGASDIRINTLEYNCLSNRLRLDVSLPEVRLTIGDAGFEAIVMGGKIVGQLKGSLSIKSIRVAGVGYVDGNINDGIKLRSVSLNFGIEGIESDLSVVFQETDRSELVNTYFNTKVPQFLEDKKEDINNVVENIVTAILNRILSF